MLTREQSSGLFSRTLRVLLVVLCCSCSPAMNFQNIEPEKRQSMSDTKEVPDQVFQSVVLNSEEEFECSPVVPQDVEWRGILIRAPKVVECLIEKGRVKSKIPICAYYFLEMDREFSVSPFVLVARDVDTGIIYKGPMLEVDDGYEIPPPGDDDTLGDTAPAGAIGGYANPNLSHYVRLPASGTYFVTLERGRQKSNKVEVRVLGKQ
jgi:hypothetical protein